MKSLKKMETVSPPDIVSSFGLWAPTEEGCCIDEVHHRVHVEREHVLGGHQLIFKRKEEKG